MSLPDPKPREWLVPIVFVLIWIGYGAIAMAVEVLARWADPLGGVEKLPGLTRGFLVLGQVHLPLVLALASSAYTCLALSEKRSDEQRTRMLLSVLCFWLFLVSLWTVVLLFPLTMLQKTL